MTKDAAAFQAVVGGMSHAPAADLEQLVLRQHICNDGAKAVPLLYDPAMLAMTSMRCRKPHDSIVPLMQKLKATSLCGKKASLKGHGDLFALQAQTLAGKSAQPIEAEVDYGTVCTNLCSECASEPAVAVCGNLLSTLDGFARLGGKAKAANVGAAYIFIALEYFDGAGPVTAESCSFFRIGEATARHGRHVAT